MPERCVAARCGNVKDPDRNISMHKIPFFGGVRLKRKSESGSTSCWRGGRSRCQGRPPLCVPNTLLQTTFKGH